jgi:vacuolar-type H+-ATPase subunit E/Vma4
VIEISRFLRTSIRIHKKTPVEKMTYNDLIKSMENGAQETIDEALLMTERVINDILEESKKKSDALKTERMRRAIEKMNMERNMAVYSLKEELKADTSATRNSMYEKAFSEAEEILKKIRQDPAYQECFSRMLQEAMPDAGEGEVRIHIDRRDERLCKECMEKYTINGEIVPDLTCSGGLNISTDRDKIICYNTIESRFARSKEALRKDIYSILSG